MKVMTAFAFQELPPVLRSTRDDGKRFIVRADEKLTAFLELQAALHHRVEPQVGSHGSSTFC